MSETRDPQQTVVDISIRIGLLALLALWCFAILRPFLQPIAWAVVIAIAAQSPFRSLERLLGGRTGAAATLLALLGVLLVILPAGALTTSLVDTAMRLQGELHEGAIAIPPPPEALTHWPLVGERLHALWSQATQNLAALLEQFAPELRALGGWLLSTLASAGAGVLKFLLSLVIAGVLLANGERASQAAIAIAVRLSGPRGADLARLAAASVQSVTRGILGVAVIQSLLAGLGMLAVGVPGAGLWALLVLLLAVVQLPVVLVLLPVALYVFSIASTAVAVVFAVWSVVIGLMDNVLKPLLMGRGVEVPMAVIFLGAIGGFLLDGIIGLFVGAVVLSVGYTLFQVWLSQGVTAPAPGAEIG